MGDVADCDCGERGYCEAHATMHVCVDCGKDVCDCCSHVSSADGEGEFSRSHISEGDGVYCICKSCASSKFVVCCECGRMSRLQLGRMKRNKGAAAHYIVT